MNAITRNAVVRAIVYGKTEYGTVVKKTHDGVKIRRAVPHWPRLVTIPREDVREVVERPSSAVRGN